MAIHPKFVPLAVIVAAMESLFSRRGEFQPAEDGLRPAQPQCEWELLADPARPGEWRMKYRYRRVDMCGIEVYDISDVRTASWQKPLSDTSHWSGRDFGIWVGGRDILTGFLRGLVVDGRVGESPIDQYVGLRVKLRGLLADNADPEACEALAVTAQRLWVTLDEDDRKVVREKLILLFGR